MSHIKHYLFLFFLCLAGTICLSQDFQAEINQQVWTVQIQSMNDLDSNRFMSTMSKDVVQISYDRKTLRDYNAFARQVGATYRRIKERKLTRAMEFRFVKRFANGSHAFENGFYKYELTSERGEKSVFYGVFQVVLRKENMGWKVLIDYDAETYEGKPVTAEEFEKAMTMAATDK